jgi:aryl-alcohol dehydrogenase-like predicted oxidoreductase
MGVMEGRMLGRSRLEVSAIGLGCLSMSEHGERESLATISLAIDCGCTFFDTADMYGPYVNEELVARAIRGRRDQVVLATKFGIVRNPADPAVRSICGRPEYVKAACEGSLKRLGTTVLDLYYQHRVDPAVPIEDTVGAMAELVTQGKVRYLGLSEAGPDTLRRAAKVHPITALQSEYSLWSRDPEDGVLQVCRELGIGFVAYSPLGRGFLTGAIKRLEDLPPDDYRRLSPRFQEANFSKNLKLVERMRDMAAAKGCTLPQLALAWLLAQGEDIVPIPGTSQRTHLRENLAARTVTLSPEDLARIDTIAPNGAAAGPRYPEAMMRLVNG